MINFIERKSLDLISNEHQELFSQSTKNIEDLTYLCELGLVVPQEIILGSRFGDSVNKESGELLSVHVKESYQYVSVINVLQLLLSQKHIYDAIYYPSNSLTKINENNYLNSRRVLNDSYSITLHFYYDECEPCNPIGSHSGNNKLGFIYWVIKNLPYYMQSGLKNINLASIFYSLDAIKYSYNKILEPLINDIRMLENGIELNTFYGCKFITASIALFTGDNLGVNSLFGFVESFSAKYCCRFCLTPKDSFNVNIKENSMEKRTVLNYNTHICIISKNNKSCYGIKFNSILNELKYFHVIDNSAVDLMHDFEEGIAKYLIKLVIRNILDKKYIRLEELNSRIQSFKYGKILSKSRPNILSHHQLYKDDSNLKQKASQMTTLILYLPVLVIDKIDNDKVWSFYMDFLEIYKLLYSPLIPIDISGYLHYLIENLITTYKTLFPENNVFFKLHLLSHYPEVISKFGPPIFYQSIRFEAKHFWFKRLVKTVYTHKNLPLTLAQRHQIYQIINIKSNTIIKPIVSGKIKIKPVNIFNCSEKIQKLLHLSSIYENICTCRWVEIHGTKYTLNQYIVLKVNEHNEPLFAKIMHIILFQNDVYFLVEQYKSLYLPEINAYAITFELAKNLIVCNHQELLYYKPYDVINTYLNNYSNTLIISQNKFYCY